MKINRTSQNIPSEPKVKQKKEKTEIENKDTVTVGNSGGEVKENIKDYFYGLQSSTRSGAIIGFGDASGAFIESCYDRAKAKPDFPTSNGFPITIGQYIKEHPGIRLSSKVLGVVGGIIGGAVGFGYGIAGKHILDGKGSGAGWY